MSTDKRLADLEAKAERARRTDGWLADEHERAERAARFQEELERLAAIPLGDVREASLNALIAHALTAEPDAALDELTRRGRTDWRAERIAQFLRDKWEWERRPRKYGGRA